MAARLIDSLWVASYGSQLASGRVYFYAPGTTTPVTVYQDDAATVVVTQPVSLDATGRTTVPVYATAPMRAVLFNSAGSQVADIERIDGDRAELVALVNSSWPGYSSVQAALTALATSMGTTNGLVKVTGSGAVPRTLQSKLSESPSIVDFGADPTGVADSYSAITSAIVAANALGGRTVLIPAGTYNTSNTLVMRAGVSLKGDGGTISVIRNTNATAACISATTLDSTVLEDFGITHSSVSTAQGVLLTGCRFSVLSRLLINNHRTCISSTDTAITNSFGHRYTSNYLTHDGDAAAINIRLNGTTAGSCGSHLVADNILAAGAGGGTHITVTGALEQISLLMNRSGNPDGLGQATTGVSIPVGFSGGGVTMVGNSMGVSGNGLDIAATLPNVVDFGNSWGTVSDTSTHLNSLVAGARGSSVTLPFGAYTTTQTLAVNGSPTMTPLHGDTFAVTASAAITVTIPAWSASAATTGSLLSIMCINASGGAVTWTFNAAYNLSAAVNPASGSRTTVNFRQIGTAFYEVGRATV
jgi:hypothetical protein